MTMEILFLLFGSKGDKDGQFDNPWGISVDGEGKIVVVDTSDRIQIFDKDFNFLMKYECGNSKYIYHVCVDECGNIIYSQPFNHSVHILFTGPQ
jgi:hypothetical protein